MTMNRNMNEAKEVEKNFVTPIVFYITEGMDQEPTVDIIVD